jgi:hypothetical protein
VAFFKCIHTITFGEFSINAHDARESTTQMSTNYDIVGRAREDLTVMAAAAVSVLTCDFSSNKNPKKLQLVSLNETI